MTVSPLPQELFEALLPVPSHTHLSARVPEHVSLALGTARFVLPYVSDGLQRTARGLVELVESYAAGAAPDAFERIGAALESARVAARTAGDPAFLALVLSLLLRPAAGLSHLQVVAGPTVVLAHAGSWRDLGVPDLEYLLEASPRLDLPWWSTITLARLRRDGLSRSPASLRIVESLVASGTWYADVLEDVLSAPGWSALSAPALEVGLALVRDGADPALALGSAAALLD